MFAQKDGPAKGKHVPLEIHLFFAYPLAALFPPAHENDPSLFTPSATFLQCMLEGKWEVRLISVCLPPDLLDFVEVW